MRHFLRLPSPAMVVACLALAVSLGGIGYAATVLPRNSVGPAQLRANAVSSAKVQDFSLLAKDFRRGQIPRGAAGPAGPAGPVGPKGDAGTPAARSWALVSAAGAVVTGNGVTGVSGTQPYVVTFAHPVNTCAVTAVPATATEGLGLQSLVSGIRLSGNNASVYIISRSNGAFSANPFSIAAFC